MLTPITDDLWCFERDLRLPRTLLLMPSRTTVVRLSSGRVLIHSPLHIDDACAKAIEAIGEPAFLVAPSCIHFLFLKAAMERWPRARVLGAAGLEKKVPGVAFDPLPREGAPEAFDGDLLVRRIEGFPYIEEHVFFHAKSRSLICTDLVFNIHACRGWGMPIFLWFAGAWKKLAQSRAWRLLVRDRGAGARSIADVLAWDIQRIVMAHGSIVEENGREHLTAALRWLDRGSANVGLLRG